VALPPRTQLLLHAQAVLPARRAALCVRQMRPSRSVSRPARQTLLPHSHSLLHDPDFVCPTPPPLLSHPLFNPAQPRACCTCTRMSRLPSCTATSRAPTCWWPRTGQCRWGPEERSGWDRPQDQRPGPLLSRLAFLAVASSLLVWWSRATDTVPLLGGWRKNVTSMLPQLVQAAEATLYEKFLAPWLAAQVGDFNLSRYMSRDRSFIKSNLENNPRWSAPEVIVDGRYSKARGLWRDQQGGLMGWFGKHMKQPMGMCAATCCGLACCVQGACVALPLAQPSHLRSTEPASIFHLCVTHPSLPHVAGGGCLFVRRGAVGAAHVGGQHALLRGRGRSERERKVGAPGMRQLGALRSRHALDSLAPAIPPCVTAVSTPFVSLQSLRATATQPPPPPQEPWEREGLNSYQIMTALPLGQRPLVPPTPELPGQLGPAAAVSDYCRLLEECWDRCGPPHRLAPALWG
jgi:hypothetical protein